jgi:MFS family permease
MKKTDWKTEPLVGKLDITGVLAIGGIVGPFVLIIADLTAAFSQHRYNFVRDSISSLALTSLGWIQTIGFLAIGLLIELFAGGLLISVRKRTGFGLGISLLSFFGFGMLLMGAFRTDPSNVPHTAEGIIHLIASAMVFWLFPIAISLLAPSLKKDPQWRGLFLYTIITSVLSLAFAIGRLLLPSPLSWFGLYERLVVANAVIWVEIIAIRLLFLSIRRQKEFKNATFAEKPELTVSQD